MDINNLLELRKRIVADAKQIALTGEGDLTGRLQVIMELIKSGDVNAELFHSAYALIEKIPADDEKLQELLNLLFEVDQVIGRQDESQEEGRSEGEGTGGQS